MQVVLSTEQFAQLFGHATGTTQLPFWSKTNPARHVIQVVPSIVQLAQLIGHTTVITVVKLTQLLSAVRLYPGEQARQINPSALQEAQLAEQGRVQVPSAFRV